MIRDKGFWVGGGASGEAVKGMLGFIEPGWLMGVEFELLGGSDGPVSVELLPPFPTPFPLTCPPGLGAAVLGEGAQLGDAEGMAGDLSLPGEAEGERSPRPEEPITWGDFIEEEEGVPAPEAWGQGG